MDIHQCQCPTCQQEAAHADQVVHRQMNICCSVGSMSSSVAGMWRWRPIGSALMEMSSWLKSPAWTLKRFNVGEKNSSTTWPSVQPTGCDCLVEAAEQRKKRRGVRSNAGGIGPARNGGRSQQSSRNGSAVVCAIGAERLEQVGHLVSPPTVARLLRKLGYSLRVNTKKQEGSRAHPERQQQFEYLETQKEAFGTAGLPISSRDTKKKELIGNAQECRTTMVSTCRRGECA
jgi:hypothetical protein